MNFKINPFNFKEICSYYNIQNEDKYKLEELFLNYLSWGGMPQRFNLNDEEEIKTYLTDIYDSIVVKDIINRYKIKDLDLFNSVLKYIVTSKDHVFSAEDMNNNLFKGKKEVSKTTLYNYVEFMEKAMLINKVDRYHIKNKRVSSGKYKYY